MPLIKKIFIVLIVFFIPAYFCYGEITKNEIHSDLGGNNFWTLKRLDIDANDRLWVVFQDSNATSYVRSAYSDDDGSTWTIEGGSPFATGYKNPSLDLDSDGSVLASCDNPATVNMPRYNIRNGSWGSSEDVGGENDVSISQVLADTNDLAFCVFRTAPDLAATTRSGGSWDTETELTLSGSYEPQSLAACMDGNSNLHAIWRATDPNNESIQTAYFDGNSWSAITSLDTFLVALDSYNPVIRNVNGTLVALWSRNGVGVNTAYIQARYCFSTTLGSWGSVGNITDRAYHSGHIDACAGWNNEIYCVLSARGVDPNNTDIANLSYTYYSGGAWSSLTTLTYEANHQNSQSIVGDGNTIHILWGELANTKQYHGSFDSTRYVPQVSIIGPR